MAAQQFPGSGTTPRLPSSDPTLPSDLADAYNDQRVSEEVSALQRTAMLSGQIETTFRTMLKGLSELVDKINRSAYTSQAGPGLIIPGAGMGGGMASPYPQMAGGLGMGMGMYGMPGPGGYGYNAPGVAGEGYVQGLYNPGIGTAGEVAFRDPERHRAGMMAPFANDQFSMGGGGQAAAHQASPKAEKPSATQQPEGRPADEQDDHQPTILSRYQEGLAAVQGASMGSIAKGAASRVSRYFSERQPPWQEDESGNYVENDAQGNPTGRVVTPQDPDYAHIGRTIRRAGWAARGASMAASASGAEGAVGTVGSLGATVARVAGPVGIAIGATAVTGHFMEKQYNEAAPYRAIYGEQGTGMFAVKDRLGESKAGLQGFGTVGGDRAREQFRAASELGLRGGAREDATGFASQMYLKLGMDTADAMSVVEQSITSGNVALDDYSKSILAVSDAAVKAGENSQAAIRDFMAAQSVVSQQAVPGAASVSIARNVSGIADQLGKPLTAALGGRRGIAALYSEPNVASAAAVSGQDPTTAISRMKNPATAVGQASRTYGDISNQIVQAVAANLGISPEQMRSDVQDLVGNNGDLTDEQQSQLLERWGGGEGGAGSAEMYIEQAFSVWGIQVSPAQANNLFFQMLQGTFEDQETKGGPGTGGRTRSGGPTRGRKSVNDPFFGAISGKYKKGRDNRSQVLSGMGYERERRTTTHADVTGAAGTIQDTPDDAKAFGSYMKTVNRSGVGDKTIEALLGTKGERRIEQYSGKDDAGDARFQVTDRQGRTHRISLAEAIGNPYYRAQLDSQRASLVGQGNNNQVDLSTITGIKKGTGSMPGSGSAGEIKHEVTLSKDARKLLKLVQPQGPSLAQRAGLPDVGAVAGLFKDYGGQ